MGWLILRAARCAAPYLTRLGRWATLAATLDEVLRRDGSPDTAAALLPHLHTAARASAGTKDEVRCGLRYARALTRLRPAEGVAELLRLLALAEARSDHQFVSAIAGDLSNHYLGTGRYQDALGMVDRQEQAGRAAGLGPWTQLGDEGQRLQIHRLQGHHRQALDSVAQLRVRMAGLPDQSDQSDQPETAAPWNVREAILNAGVFAARGLGLWQDSLDLNAEVVASKRARGATNLEIAHTQANDYGSLRALGRLGEARALLLDCRTVFETEHDIASLGKTLSALADIEDELGHRRDAITLERDALRLIYATGDADSIGVSHHNLAHYLTRHTALDTPRQRAEVWAHRLAAAVLAYQTGSGALPSRLAALAGLARTDPGSAPTTFGDVCAVVDQTEGVHLAALEARLPRRAPDGQTAMAEVLTLARQLPPPAPEDPDRYLRMWAPVISALAATHPNPDTTDTDTTDSDTTGGAGGPEVAGAFLTQALERYAATPDWTALVEALRRVRAGDRDPAQLTGGLDEIDTAIVGRALAALDGSDPIDRTLWTTTTGMGEDDETTDGVAAFIAAAAAAAAGDPDAEAAIGPILEQMDADPEYTALAGAVRAIIGGQRDIARLPQDLAPHARAVAAELLAALTPPTPDPAEGGMEPG